MKRILDRERIPQMYSGGMSLRAIGKIVGLTVGAVRSVLVARNVTLRTGREAFQLKYPSGRKGPDNANWRGGRNMTYGKTAEERGIAPSPMVRKNDRPDWRVPPPPMRGPDHPGWKGGRWEADHGGGRRYVYFWKPDHPRATKAGYVMEHRLVAEQTLGRILEKWEVIHHINGDRLDNRAENLEVLKRGDHTRIHFAHCLEVAELKAKLKRYEERYGPLEND